MLASNILQAVYLDTKHSQLHSKPVIVSISPARDGDLARFENIFLRVDETFFEQGKTLHWLKAKRYVVGCTERELKEAGA